MDAPKLDVLKCPSCGAAVAFGDDEEVACVHCGAKVPIPAPYRELRNANRADEAARRDADDVLRKLDEPSWLVTRVLAVTLDQPMLVFLFFYGVPVGLFSIFWAMDTASMVARWLGHANADDLPFWVTSVLIVFWLFVLTFVPRALGVYANRRAAGRGALLAALAARPPTTPGGPAECRVCGAPLSLGDGELVVKCIYCQAENAVKIRSSIVIQAKGVAKRIGATARQAWETDVHERRETRRALFAELRRYLYRVLVFGLLLAAYSIDSERPENKVEGAVPVIGMIALFSTVFVVIFFIFQSASLPDDDAAERRTGAGLPDWVRYVAPLSVWFVLYWASQLYGWWALRNVQMP